MNLENQLDYLAENIILLQARTEQLQRHSESVAQQASEAVSQANSTLEEVAANLRNTAAKTISNATRKPFEELEKQIQDTCRELVSNTNYVDNRQKETVKKLNTVLWAMLMILILAILTTIASTYALVKYTRQEIYRADWVSSINQAVEKGNLLRCENGKGICAKVKGKLVQLDK